MKAKVDAYFAPYVAQRDFSGVVLIARGQALDNAVDGLLHEMEPIDSQKSG